MVGNLCFKKSVGLAYSWKANKKKNQVLPCRFLLCFTLYLRAISKYKSLWASVWRGNFNGGFFALRVWWAYTGRGLYLERLIFRILK